MGENSNIEWTHHTFNPWIGCTKVSPGCANCYAETLMATRYGRVKWGRGNPRSRTSVENWRKPLRWNKTVICGQCGRAEVLGSDDCRYCGKELGIAPVATRPRVFCASLADWLDDEVDTVWLYDLLALIQDTPNLDWLLLTKRLENWRLRLKASMNNASDRADDFICNWLDGNPPKNVWLGVSAEDQPRWNERLPLLMDTPASVRFVSAEPLLDTIDMGRYRPDWLIAGGESGPGARRMPENSLRWLLHQSQPRHEGEKRVAFFFKQWGGVDKRSAGRLIDGRSWDELPLVATKTEQP